MIQIAEYWKSLSGGRRLSEFSAKTVEFQAQHHLFSLVIHSSRKSETKGRKNLDFLKLVSSEISNYKRRWGLIFIKFWVLTYMDKNPLQIQPSPPWNTKSKIFFSSLMRFCWKSWDICRTKMSWKIWLKSPRDSTDSPKILISSWKLY